MPSTPSLWLAVAPRAILHVDMDAFFASVEQLDNPALRGKPVLVGGTSGRGVVCAASYEARSFGCKSAMPMARAIRLCPHAVVMKPRGSRYLELSRRVRDILDAFSPLIQPVSIDEAFLDVTGSIPLLGEPAIMADQIRRRVRAEVGLTCSVGVAPNKFLAKLASDMHKPDGLTVLGPSHDAVQRAIDPLPVSRMWGVGPKTEPRLLARGWRTFRDLREAGPDALEAALGDFGVHCARFAQGLDDRPVHADRDAKSIGHEETFFDDVADPDELRAILLAHVEHVARRLRKASLLARTLSLKLRRPDFKTITRAATLDQSTDDTTTLWHAARDILEAWLASPQRSPLRLLGVHLASLSAHGTTTGAQLDLFEPPRDQAAEKRHRVDEASDAIARKFGPDAIRRARSIRPER